MGLNKIFRKAKVKWPWMPPINIGQELDTVHANNKIGYYGPLGHRAIEEIRQAIQMMEAPKVSQMRFNDIPAGSSDWSPSEKALWKRFWLWQNWADNRDVKACMMLAEGNRLRAIEKAIGVSLGHGYGVRHIKSGVEVYVDVLRMEDSRVAEAEAIERIYIDQHDCKNIPHSNRNK